MDSGDSELTYVCEANKVFCSTDNYILILSLSLYRGLAELNHKGMGWCELFSVATQVRKVSI